MKRYEALTDEYDQSLSAIRHYQHYPEMMVAVGAHYSCAPLRVLVLGESHYLDAHEPGNTAALWYTKRQIHLAGSEKNIRTRSVFNNAIGGHARRKSKMIFYALASALHECTLAPPEVSNPLQAIAYMNFFQRPAERKGKSIIVQPEDVIASTEVLNAVIDVLKPQLVIFATRLGWRHARLAQIPARLASLHVQAQCVPHPATSWWNRPSKPMQGKTGRRHFIDVVTSARDAVLPD